MSPAARKTATRKAAAPKERRAVLPLTIWTTIAFMIGVAFAYYLVLPNGLYFLDEPETPLSPARILALISLIKLMVDEGCQFIIATHSPISAFWRP